MTRGVRTQRSVGSWKDASVTGGVRTRCSVGSWKDESVTGGVRTRRSVGSWRDALVTGGVRTRRGVGSWKRPRTGKGCERDMRRGRSTAGAQATAVHEASLAACQSYCAHVRCSREFSILQLLFPNLSVSLKLPGNEVLKMKIKNLLHLL